VFHHSISPYIIRIYGDFGIRWYGLFYVIGFVSLYFFLRHLSRKKLIKNLPETALDRLIIYLVLGIIIGARFFHVFVFEPGYYFSHPADMIKIWQGGLSFHGGLVGGMAAAFLFCRKYKVRFFELADGTAIIVGLFLGLGRIANFINGELYGKITSVSWCVDYSHSQYIANPPDGCRHPSQIYEFLYSVFIFGVLSIAFAKDKGKKAFGTGIFFWGFITLYGILRFFVTFTRDERGILGTPIAEAQYFSLLMFIIGGMLFYKTIKKVKR
jgi:phosphatidylglycerol:prolipoprotein diacylglycerol transferase